MYREEHARKEWGERTFFFFFFFFIRRYVFDFVPCRSKLWKLGLHFDSNADCTLFSVFFCKSDVIRARVGGLFVIALFVVFVLGWGFTPCVVCNSEFFGGDSDVFTGKEGWEDVCFVEHFVVFFESVACLV